MKRRTFIKVLGGLGLGFAAGGAKAAKSFMDAAADLAEFEELNRMTIPNGEKALTKFVGAIGKFGFMGVDHDAAETVTIFLFSRPMVVESLRSKGIKKVFCEFDIAFSDLFKDAAAFGKKIGDRNDVWQHKEFPGKVEKFTTDYINRYPDKAEWYDPMPFKQRQDMHARLQSLFITAATLGQHGIDLVPYDFRSNGDLLERSRKVGALDEANAAWDKLEASQRRGFFSQTAGLLTALAFGFGKKIEMEAWESAQFLRQEKRKNNPVLARRDNVFAENLQSDKKNMEFILRQLAPDEPALIMCGRGHMETPGAIADLFRGKGKPIVTAACLAESGPGDLDLYVHFVDSCGDINMPDYVIGITTGRLLRANKGPDRPSQKTTIVSPTHQPDPAS